MAGWLKLNRSEKTLELMQDRNAFILLCHVAYRAKRTDSFSVHNLQKGQALVGDYKAMGFTRQEYRTALANLQKWSLLTIKSTNKGTIVTLINSDIWDINIEDNNQPVTNQQPTNNQPTTTNKNIKKEKNEKNDKNTDKEERKVRHLENVLLTPEEYLKLIDRLGKIKTDTMIERLNNGIGSKGYKYKSHYHTILTWVNKDQKEDPQPHQQKIFNDL